MAEILGRLRPLEEVERVPLSLAVGRVLAEPVRSDVDLPPFDKSAVDGYAVRSADFSPSEDVRSLPVVGESRAGEPYSGELASGACIAIYTGAEVPRGADAIVMVELSERSGGEVRLRDRPRPLQNLCKRGEDLARGGSVLSPGRRIRSVDLAVLAAVGCQPVGVFRRPRASVLTSGDELVRPDERPGPGQIREGNTLHLSALAHRAGAEVANLGVVRDEPSELERVLRAALDGCDLLITTGGVSMGKYDLVGATLERLGVEPVFHKVAIKPGKPLWFGMFGRVPVFALPGNPVSCLVNHEVFVRPAIEKLSGVAEEAPPLRRGRWAGGEVRPNEREQHLPVRLHPGEDGIEVLEPVRWNGSADVVGISRAEGLAVVPIGTGASGGMLLEYRALD
jgi:molybdopterin molybdotransferase